MPKFLVMERQPSGWYRDEQTGKIVKAHDPGNCPVYNMVQTVVDAPDAETAVKAAMGQTRRMGESYAVVECKVLSFMPDQGETTVEGGVIVATPQLIAGTPDQQPLSGGDPPAGVGG